MGEKCLSMKFHLRGNEHSVLRRSWILCSNNGYIVRDHETGYIHKTRVHSLSLEGVQKKFKKFCLVRNLPICLCAYVGHQIFLIQKHHGSWIVWNFMWKLYLYYLCLVGHIHCLDFLLIVCDGLSDPGNVFSHSCVHARAEKVNNIINIKN